MSRTGNRRTATNRQSNNVRYTYIEGNTVRQVRAVPVRREQERREPQRKAPVSTGTLKNREKALRMSAGYVLFLSAAAITLLVVCSNYIKLQSQIQNRSKNINTLESELSELKILNDATYNKLVASVDLNYIQQIASEELGMIYATEAQVELYSSQDSDYVRQYQDLPDSK